MVYVTGTFTFQEARGKVLAHIFALCDIGTGVYEPISQMGHQRVRGVDVQKDGSQLRVRSTLLAPNFKGALIGLYVTGVQSLTSDDYVLRLTFEDRSSRVLHPPIENAHHGDRFAVLARLSPLKGEWNVSRLDPPAIFRDKHALSGAYPVPMWWRQHA